MASPPQPVPPSPHESSLGDAYGEGDPPETKPSSPITGRNLVVCIDGTLQQLGSQNTNVVELCRALTKSPEQHVYYSPGIGTYFKPKKYSFNWMMAVIDEKIDALLAWNIDVKIRNAYQWLSHTYEDGDKIYLFGFSRGAYQVRALAAMIRKVNDVAGIHPSPFLNDLQVGLLYKANSEQVQYAYSLYVSSHGDEEVDYTLRQSGSGASSKTEKETRAEHYRRIFLGPRRGKIRVHYIGVWDTVAAVGIFRGKTLPGVNNSNHAMYCRHALALDERRVIFRPEYFRDSPPDDAMAVKEVWFRGTHSDVGGGLEDTSTENVRENVPLWWMMFEAKEAGILLDYKFTGHTENQMKSEGFDKTTESLTWRWWPFEIYKFNFGRGRQMRIGQKIHGSVLQTLPGKSQLPRAKLFRLVGDQPWFQWSGLRDIDDRIDDHVDNYDKWRDFTDYPDGDDLFLGVVFPAMNQPPDQTAPLSPHPSIRVPVAGQSPQNESSGTNIKDVQNVDAFDNLFVKPEGSNVKPAVIYFSLYRDLWCRKMDQSFKRISDTTGIADKVEFWKVDVVQQKEIWDKIRDKGVDMSEGYRVLPRFIFRKKDGSMSDGFAGADEGVLREWIKGAISGTLPPPASGPPAPDVAHEGEDRAVADQTEVERKFTTNRGKEKVREEEEEENKKDELKGELEGRKRKEKEGKSSTTANNPNTTRK
ncbi:hypothetical protein EVG20_g6095 [Dentipellis fragilis]|uniref:T6SS Phospholipase effector Tle1-like catalytic domain-containing protein n=1 Tax=Dentipellis fragilis TaxID=205917 RepID=A0A4Y9YQI8_9AGAM|nr:hypothetical protein EVG20_g6095 [Dentipellis fragilis]